MTFPSPSCFMTERMCQYNCRLVFIRNLRFRIFKPSKMVALMHADLLVLLPLRRHLRKWKNRSAFLCIKSHIMQDQITIICTTILQRHDFIINMRRLINVVLTKNLKKVNDHSKKKRLRNITMNEGILFENFIKKSWIDIEKYINFVN